MPSPWYITPGKRAAFSYGGKDYDLPAGKRYDIPFTSACQALGFVNELHKATDAPQLRDGTSGAYDKLQDQCTAERHLQPGDADNLDPPPTPPPVDNPSATGNDNAPPIGNETAESLQSPAVQGQQTELSSEHRTPGTSDGRPLAQQVHDKQDPMSEDDVKALLRNQGVSTSELPKKLQSVLHNDAPDGTAHPDCSRNTRKKPEAVLDPVIVHSGAFTIDVTDVEIASVGLPLRLVRSYRSGAVSWGPWGYGWDHNYHVYLRELVDGSVAVWTGRFVEEVYRPAGTGFTSPLGVFRKLERTAGAAVGYRLLEAGGESCVFEVPASWPLSDQIPLVRIEDRHGNVHQLSYDDQGRLGRVSDPAAAISSSTTETAACSRPSSTTPLGGGATCTTNWSSISSPSPLRRRPTSHTASPRATNMTSSASTRRCATTWFARSEATAS